MLRQRGESSASVDHAWQASRLGDDGPSEVGKLLSQLDFAEGLCRASRDRRAQSKRVEPTEASLELVDLRKIGVDLLGEQG
jgi:hypothetical protein